ncbi:MAG: hypothetical protein ACI4SS_05390, partial [Clostridia bacterium]
MSFCRVFIKRMTALAAAFAVLFMNAAAISQEQVSESIYGIYNWKKGENQFLLNSLTVGDSGGDWYACAVVSYGIEDNYQGYLSRL